MPEAFGHRVDVGGVGGAEGDEVEALLVVLAEAYGVLLRRALGGKEGEPVLGRLRLEAPHVGVELELLVVVGHGEVDVAKVGDQALAGGRAGDLGHRSCPLVSAGGQAGSATRWETRAISPGTSPWTPSSSHWLSWSELSTTVFARS